MDCFAVGQGYNAEDPSTKLRDASPEPNPAVTLHFDAGRVPGQRRSLRSALSITPRPAPQMLLAARRHRPINDVISFKHCRLRRRKSRRLDVVERQAIRPPRTLFALQKCKQNRLRSVCTTAVVAPMFVGREHEPSLIRVCLADRSKSEPTSRSSEEIAKTRTSFARLPDSRCSGTTDMPLNAFAKTRWRRFWSAWAFGWPTSSRWARISSSAAASAPDSRSIG